MFDETLFDWINGRIKIGSDWVWFAAEEQEAIIKCKFDSDNIEFSDFSKLKGVVNNYCDLFASNPKAPKECLGVTHEIILSEDRVCVDRVNRIPNKFTETVAEQVQEMLDNNIIRNSSSAYNSNPLLVNKKDGTKRFVVDFRSLNKITYPDKYPLPNVNEIIEECRNAKWFSQLDLAAGYWCVPIAEKDRHKTAFSVPRGKFEFNRMPFGLNNSQATFQRLMDLIVKNIKQRGYRGVDAYVDNLLIYTESLEEHCIILNQVFQELRKFNLTLRSDKCEIGFKEMDFLGFHISFNGVRPSEENVIKISNFPKPTTKKHIQRFLGLANFNRKFVQQYATITKSLTKILSDSEKFVWEEEQQRAFDRIKSILTRYPCLSIPDWKIPFHIETDASSVATGAVLYQIEDNGDKNPIAYHSKTLTKAQSKWSATERELFAIVDASRKFKTYCMGEAYFHTDHQPLKNIRHQKDPRGKVGRWLLELDAIDCKIEYLPGKDNLAADCLSREVVLDPPKYREYEIKADEAVYSTLEFQPEYDTPQKICNEQQKDTHIRNAIKQIEVSGKIKSGPFKYFSNGMLLSPNGLLLKGKRVIAPKHLHTRLIMDYHGQNHSGIDITTAMIRERFWFKAIASQVKKLIENCQTCRQTRKDNDRAPLVIRDDKIKPWEIIAMDVGSMPNSQRGNKCFLLVVDHSSKFCSAIALPHQQGPLIKSALWKTWLGVYGMPKKLLSDQAKNMDGAVINQLCTELKIQKRHSSPYHPQGNGSAERAIGTLKLRLSAMCQSRGMDISDWDLLIPEAILLMNNQVNKSLKYTPFKYNFGCEARLPIDNHYQLESVGNELPTGVVQGDANANRVDAKISYKKQYDKKVVTKNSLHVGDAILLKRTFGENPKMSVKWREGYTLVKKIGPVNWVVENKNGAQKVYHRNLIKLAGSRTEPEFIIQHKPYVLADKRASNIIQPRINIPTTSDPGVNTNEVQHSQTLSSTLDRQGFSESVLGLAPSNNSNVTVTSRGRVSQPVIGNRLIDQIGT